MRLLAGWGSLRTVVAVLTVLTAVQMLLIAIGNITDFGTNQAFVQHVFAMDTTFRSPHMMWRAITNLGVVNTAYAVVIAWESISGLVLLAGAVSWIRAIAGKRPTTVARQLSICGWLMWVILFGGGFLAIGGEYFQMWQSAKWNGLQPAVQDLLVASIGLLLAGLLERQPAGQLSTVD